MRSPEPTRLDALLRRRSLTIFAVVWTLASGSPDVRADLYRCQRQDGSVVYTNSQATCPGAPQHEPRAEVQTVESTGAHKRQEFPQRLPRTMGALEGEREAHWRRKKLDAERELTQISGQIAELEPFVKICNRGGYLYLQQDNGLKKAVACDSVRADLDALQTQRAKLDSYLDSGLRDECRTAGCLPGWLR
jgi:hypothetical protein